MKPPVFIIGNPRSGTTLLRLMLNNHSNIVVPPECGFAVWWYEKYRDWNDSSRNTSCVLERFLHDLGTSKKIEAWNLNYGELERHIRSMKPPNYAGLVSCIYVFYGRSTGKIFHRWGDKNNFHVQQVDLLHALFPDAYFVHIVRDGRDVACSYKALAKTQIRSKYAPNLPTDIVSIAAEWNRNIEIAISSFETFDWQQVYEVHYENLVADSRIELERICNFLEEPYDERMLSYYAYNLNEHQEPAEFLQWKSKTLEAPTTSEVGKFRFELTEEEIMVFESISRRALVRYGYECVS